MIDFGIFARIVLLAVCVLRCCHSSFELCHPPCHVCSSSLLVVSVGQARRVGCVDAFYRSAGQVPTARTIALSIGLLSFSLVFSRLVVVGVVVSSIVVVPILSRLSRLDYLSNTHLYVL